MLKPGGVFLKDDSRLTPSPWQPRFEYLRYRYIPEREQALRGITRSIEEIAAERKAHQQRHQNYRAPMRDQLEWLTGGRLRVGRLLLEVSRSRDLRRHQGG